MVKHLVVSVVDDSVENFDIERIDHVSAASLGIAITPGVTAFYSGEKLIRRLVSGGSSCDPKKVFIILCSQVSDIFKMIGERYNKNPQKYKGIPMVLLQHARGIASTVDRLVGLKERLLIDEDDVEEMHMHDISVLEVTDEEMTRFMTHCRVVASTMRTNIFTDTAEQLQKLNEAYKLSGGDDKTQQEILQVIERARVPVAFISDLQSSIEGLNKAATTSNYILRQLPKKVELLQRTGAMMASKEDGAEAAISQEDDGVNCNSTAIDSTSTKKVADKKQHTDGLGGMFDWVRRLACCMSRQE